MSAPTSSTAYGFSGVKYTITTGGSGVSLNIATAGGTPIRYLERTHVEVWRTLDNFATATLLTNQVDYTFSGNGLAILITGDVDAETAFAIQRVTPRSGYVQFVDGQQLGAAQLNRLTNYSAFVDQELSDQIANIAPSSAPPTNLDALTDVTLTALTAGQVLKYDGTGWINSVDLVGSGGGGALGLLDELTDVTITAPANGQVLGYDGTQWLNIAAPSGGAGTVTNVVPGSGLTGSVVDGVATVNVGGGPGSGITVAADSIAVNRGTTDSWYAAQGHTHTGSQVTGQYTSSDLTLNTQRLLGRSSGSLGRAEEISLSGLTLSGGVLGIGSISACNDVTLSSPAANEILRYDGAQWVNAPNSTQNITLDNLTDVTVTSPGAGQLLSYNGTQWVPASASAFASTAISREAVGGTSVQQGQATFSGTGFAGFTGIRISRNAAGGLDEGPLLQASTFVGQRIEIRTLGGFVVAQVTSLTYTPGTTTPNLLLNCTRLVSVGSAISGQATITLGANSPVDASVVLDSIADVAITSPTDGQVLSYSTAGTRWENRPVLRSNATGITGASAISNIVSMSQAAYDALAGSRSPSTLYIVPA